jgi:quercetin dioxygenase-like cupin family protein
MRLVVGPSAEALEEIVMGPGEARRIRPGTVHRMVAVSDCDVLEASTPHLDDVVRLEDRYGRDSRDPY